MTDLASFRRWAKSDVAPEQTPVFYLSGEVWIDMSKEQIFTHVRLKQELCRILGNLVRLEGRGDLFPDGLLLSNMDAKISVNPDGDRKSVV